MRLLQLCRYCINGRRKSGRPQTSGSPTYNYNLGGVVHDDTTELNETGKETMETAKNRGMNGNTAH